jgi:hypothetical protein
MDVREFVEREILTLYGYGKWLGPTSSIPQERQVILSPKPSA